MLKRRWLFVFNEIAVVQQEDYRRSCQSQKLYRNIMLKIFFCALTAIGTFLFCAL